LNVVLLADGEWVKLIGVVVAVIFWVVSKLLSMRKEQPPQPRRLMPRDFEEPGDGGPPLSNEIEDFLKNAAARREGQPPPPDLPRPRSPRRRSAAAREALLEAQRGAAPRRPPQAPVPEFGERRSHESVAEHVQQRLGSHLESKVEHRDEAMQAHLSQVFQHEVGHLKGRRLSESREVPVAAEILPVRLAAKSIAEMLTAENIRTAIILNEILTRPNQSLNRGNAIGAAIGNRLPIKS